MGEQRRKHIDQVIAQAIMCGAVFDCRGMSDKRRRGKLMKVWHAFDDGVLFCTGETEYQCAVNFLTSKGVSYETLAYGSGGADSGTRTRLRRWERQRGCDTRKP